MEIKEVKDDTYNAYTSVYGEGLSVKKTFLVFALLFAISTAFSFELNAGVSYSFSNKLFYSFEFNTFAITQNSPNTTSGLCATFISDFSQLYLAMVGGTAKYDMKLSIGTVSLYGTSGMIVPVDNFGFEKITSIVRVGAKYYFQNIVFSTGIFSFYLIDNTKYEGIDVSVGYTF